MRHKSLVLASVVLLAFSTVQSIHAQEPMAQHASAAVKFVPIAGLPPCLTGAKPIGMPAFPAALAAPGFPRAMRMGARSSAG